MGGKTTEIIVGAEVILLLNLASHGVTRSRTCQLFQATTILYFSGGLLCGTELPFCQLHQLRVMMWVRNSQQTITTCRAGVLFRGDLIVIF